MSETLLLIDFAKFSNIPNKSEGGSRFFENRQISMINISEIAFEIALEIAQEIALKIALDKKCISMIRRT